LNFWTDYKGNKSFRLLNMYERLNKGEQMSKQSLVLQFGVSEKTVQRDIDDLRAFLAETHCDEWETDVRYDKAKNVYYLVRPEREWLTNEEVLATCKILLESRAFCKQELGILLDKLLAQTSPTDREHVKEIFRNERFNYVPLRHGKKLLSILWELSQHVIKHDTIEITYTRKDGIRRKHQVKPVAILFSEFYFYLITFMADDSKNYPTVFRVDRLEEVSATGDTFEVPYQDRFNDGDFRNRVQFMFSGPLQTVQFCYNGASIESVLDRLPSAEVINHQDDTYTIRAEVYGNGIDMWLRSQGDHAWLFDAPNPTTKLKTGRE